MLLPSKAKKKALVDDFRPNVPVRRRQGQESFVSVSVTGPSQHDVSLRLNADGAEESANRGCKASQWGALLRLKALLICFVEAFILSDVTEQVT